MWIFLLRCNQKYASWHLACCRLQYKQYLLGEVTGQSPRPPAILLLCVAVGAGSVDSGSIIQTHCIGKMATHLAFLEGVTGLCFKWSWALHTSVPCA